MVINTLFTITFAVELLAELRTWLTLSIDGNDAIDPISDIPKDTLVDQLVSRASGHDRGCRQMCFMVWTMQETTPLMEVAGLQIGNEVAGNLGKCALAKHQRIVDPLQSASSTDR